MDNFLDEISTKTSVSDISIIKEEYPASEILDNCRSAMGFVYNAIQNNNPTDESHLQNIYFGAKEDKLSLFKIYLNGSVFHFNQDHSLANLSIINEDSSYDRINDIKKIEKMDDTWNPITFDIKKKYIMGLEVILPDVFYIKDMPDIGSVSIKIEQRSLKNAFNNHRSSGIFFERLPKDVFGQLIDYNEKHHLGYKIYTG